MEASRKSFKNEYVDGSTVKKLQEVPFRQDMVPERRRPLTEEEFREIKRRERAAQGQKERVRANNKGNSIDLISSIILSGAIIITLYVCVSFLMVQSRITSMSKETAKLESELVQLQNDNNTTLERINTSVDLAYIYKVATEELKMVHAKKNQIISYDQVKSDYARKYSDIPEAPPNNILDKILDK